MPIFQGTAVLSLSALLLAAALAAPAAEPRAAGHPAGDITLPDCTVTASRRIAVAAREAGMLEDVKVKEGDQVMDGQMLAQIDDKRAQSEYAGAVYKYEEEDAQAKKDIDVQFARAAADVAWAQLQTSVEANSKVPGAVPSTTVREQELSHKKFKLEIEQSQFHMEVHGMEARVKQAEADVAKENIQRRKVLAPTDGVVVEIRKQKGEWVQAGDAVLRVIRVDRMWVEGSLKASEYAQAEVFGRPVTVTVTLAHGRRESFQGKIILANQEIQTNGEFHVRAEVLNRQENDFWLLSDGTAAEMTIHLE